MSLQEHGFVTKGEPVMVIIFMYSALDHKCCTFNVILYSIPKVKDILVASPPLLFLFLNTSSDLHIKLNVGYPGEYKKQW